MTKIIFLDLLLLSGAKSLPWRSGRSSAFAASRRASRLGWGDDRFLANGDFSLGRSSGEGLGKGSAAQGDRIRTPYVDK